MTCILVINVKLNLYMCIIWTKPKNCPDLCSNRNFYAKMDKFAFSAEIFIFAENYEFDICISSKFWSHIQSGPTKRHAKRRLSKVSTRNELANQMLKHQMNKRNENPQPNPNRLTRLLWFPLFRFILLHVGCEMWMYVYNCYPIVYFCLFCHWFHPFVRFEEPLEWWQFA